MLQVIRESVFPYLQPMLDLREDQEVAFMSYQPVSKLSLKTCHLVQKITCD